MLYQGPLFSLTQLSNHPKKRLTAGHGECRLEDVNPVLVSVFQALGQ